MSQITLALAVSRTIQIPIAVSGTSNAGGLVQVQTSTAHGLLTNDLTQLVGIGGTVEANGQSVITKVDATHFTLNNSAFAHSFTSGGQVVHIGFATAAVLIDNTVFPTPPDFTLTTRMESLSEGFNARLFWEDAVDSGFVTAEPLAVIQHEALTGGVNGEGIVTSIKRESAPDARLGVAGAHLRLKVYISGGFWSTAQLSTWLTY